MRVVWKCVILIIIFSATPFPAWCVSAWKIFGWFCLLFSTCATERGWFNQLWLVIGPLDTITWLGWYFGSPQGSFHLTFIRWYWCSVRTCLLSSHHHGSCYVWFICTWFLFFLCCLYFLFFLICIEYFLSRCILGAIAFRRNVLENFMLVVYTVCIFIYFFQNWATGVRELSAFSFPSGGGILH